MPSGVQVVAVWELVNRICVAVACLASYDEFAEEVLTGNPICVCSCGW